MAATIPTTLPPPEIHDKVLAILLARTRSTPLTDTVALLPPLGSIYQILAYKSLHVSQRSTISTYPLRALATLSESSPSCLGLSILLDAAIAYPLHVEIVNSILSRCFDNDPSLVEQIEQSVLPVLLKRLEEGQQGNAFPVVRTLLTLIRAHEELLGLILGEADVFLPALSKLYNDAAIAGGNDPEGHLRVKQDILLIVHALITAVQGAESREMIKRLLGDKSGSGILLDNGLKGDYESIFEKGSRPSNDVLEGLQSVQRAEQGEDQRLPMLVSLFPHIPAQLLRDALAHPHFASTTSSASPEEGAAPLVEAILSGGADLPEELGELRKAIGGSSPPDGESSLTNGNGPTAGAERKKIERSNIWDGEMDISKLKIKDASDVSLPQVAAIPDHLRESILRLVQSQAAEEEERERAVAEAHSGGAFRPVEYDEEDDVPRVKVTGTVEGDDSDADDGESISTNLVDKTRRPAQVKTYDPDLQSKLELAYLANPGIFDRDSQTRRTEGRRKLKDATGMDDSQLEGWRIMLEKNPHKDAILARHQFIPPNNRDYLTPARSENGSSSSRGSRGGRGGGRGSSNGGGGGSSRNGSSRGGGGSEGGSSHGGGEGGSSHGGGAARGGGGGPRGRGQNKGSRGHSNAARARGHDRKMTKMGAGS